MELENKIKKHAVYFSDETDRILRIIRNDGTRFNIYQTKDSTQNQYNLDQEVKMIVSNHLVVPHKLLNEYPLPYLISKILTRMVKERILAEPEVFIVD